MGRINIESVADEIAAKLGIVNEPGWEGAFTRAQAPEAAYRNGARVVKMLHEHGDTTPLGSEGTVLGSIYYPGGGVAYFIEWDHQPRLAVFVVEAKIEGVP